MTTLRQLSRIALAMLTMMGRVTMRGISRWAGDGGSYRTVQRFFTTVIRLAALFWRFLRTHLFHPDDVCLLGGDETVVTKAGTHTHGLDRFFAGLSGKPVPGLAFFTLSLISTTQRRSFPMAVEQVVRTPAEKKRRGPKQAQLIWHEYAISTSRFATKLGSIRPTLQQFLTDPSAVLCGFPHAGLAHKRTTA